MPLLTVAATKMDTDRIISNDGSPGSGQSHQDFAIINSLARRKKQHPLPPDSRPLPPLDSSHSRPLPPLDNAHSRPLPSLQVSDHSSHAPVQSSHAPVQSSHAPVQGRIQQNGQMAMYGINNQAFTRHDQSSSSIHGARLNTTCETTVSLPEEDDQQEVIQVQILEQDENWGETTTAITTTSDLDYAMEDLSKWQITNERTLGFKCKRYFGPICSALLATAAFLSPIAMAVIPQTGVFEIPVEHLECDVTCDGMLISFAFKMLILLIGTWAVFFRQPRTSLPRIFVFRAIVSVLVLVFLISFWLFYGVHLMEEKNRIKYKDIVQFALSFIDALLFIHYLAIILLELRHATPQFYVKVVRSPDGQSGSYAMGQLSIQRAAATVLEKYLVDFPIYNPYLETMAGARAKKGYKVYDVDGITNGTINDGNSTVVSVASKRGHSSHNERFYDEAEYERKVRKRRSRLVTATEESFTHIRRMREEVLGSSKRALSPDEAAAAVFPSLSRPLQKYLRVTRQQPRHTIDGILKHLATSLSYDLSPRAFLERYLVTSPVLQNDRELGGVQSWALICDNPLYLMLSSGTTFQLRQGDVSLLCEVHSLPHLNMTEEIIDPKSNKFVLKMSSETSV